jgi:hypothetical protein
VSFQVQGAWTRQSVSIDGSEHFELQHVYWLQTDSVYADLRVPFHPAGGTACFAGRSGWDGDRYRWSHPLDLSNPDPASASDPDPTPGPDPGPGRARGCASRSGPDDIGHLIMDGDRLVERGRLPGGTTTYEEIWVRLPGDDGEVEAIESPAACHVQVGDHAITIVDGRPEGGSFNACYQVRTARGWEVGAAIGERLPRMERQSR